MASSSESMPLSASLMEGVVNRASEQFQAV